VKDLYATFRRHLYLPDTAALDFGVAHVVAHRQSGDPLWGIIVGPSGATKTEVIRSLGGIPEVHPVSTLTPSTLISGMKRGSNQTGRRSPSLLLRMDAAGLSFITMKDFTTILETRRESRAEILGQLREVYDGSFSKAFGTGETVTWEGRLGLLAGVTPVIDTHRQSMAILGERFLYLRLDDADPREMARAARLERDEGAMRSELAAAVVTFLDGVDYDRRLREEDGEFLDALAIFAAWVRTGVLRDTYRPDHVLARPQRDAPTRLVKQLGALYRALVAMGHSDPRGFTTRVARDSVPRDRWDALILLAGGPTRRGELSDGLGLPQAQYKTVQRLMEDLEMLGLVDVTRDEDHRPEDGIRAPNVYSLSAEAGPVLSQMTSSSLDNHVPPHLNSLDIRDPPREMREMDTLGENTSVQVEAIPRTRAGRESPYLRRERIAARMLAEMQPSEEIVGRLCELLADDPDLMRHPGDIYDIFTTEGLFNDHVLYSVAQLWAIICTPEPVAA
jgi:hypothetical protein